MSGCHRWWQATVSLQWELVWAPSDRSESRVCTGGRPSMTITRWSARVWRAVARPLVHRVASR